MPLEILRTIKTRKALGLSNGGFYERLRRGLIPPPFNLGARARGYPSDEVEAVARAMVAGWTDEAIAALVAEMAAQRHAKAQMAR